MSNPKISIIVPVYNVEKYLNKCVESILNQTFKDFELILVDDGSQDACPKICDEYEKKDIRIKVIHKKNGGLSDARNAGLKISKGEYISFVDSDDYVDTNMYEKMYGQITQKNADMIVCNYVKVENTEEGINELSGYQLLENVCYSREDFIAELLEEHGGYYVVAWNKLYKKSLFYDLKFPVGKNNEDEFVIHHIIDKCDKIVCIKDKLYYYLQREGSIMHSDNIIQKMDYCEALIDRYYLTKKRGYKRWKEHTVVRLSYEIEKWRTFARRDKDIRKKYNMIRKKSLFLLCERKAWEFGNIKCKVYNRIMLLWHI